MTVTPHLGITLVEQSQAQKEVTVNEALMRLDAVVNAGVKDKDLATPPASPAEGDVYIVAASPTGAWAGQAGKLAYFNQIWRFITPKEGVTLWVNDEDVPYTYDGAAWVRTQGVMQAGVQTTNATTTVIASIPLAEGEMVMLEAAVNGLRNDASEGYAAKRIAAFRRATGGNVTQIGTTAAPFDSEDFSGSPTATVVANTTAQTVEIKVTGEAAKTINWVCRYQYLKTT